jgi:hypothetical protein
VVWAAGDVRDEDNHGTVQVNVLRRYASSGALLGQVAIDSPASRSRDAAASSSIRASKDRVGWISGGRVHKFALDGKQVYQGAGPPLANPELSGDISFDYDSAGRLIVSETFSPRRVMKLWELDRESRTWRPVPIRGREDSFGRILGFDDRALVLAEGHLRVKIYPSLSSAAE